MERFKQMIGQQHAVYSDVLVQETRLIEVLDRQKFGFTQETDARLAEIVDRLNALALQSTGRSFNAFCRD
jgi:hypothetical protein